MSFEWILACRRSEASISRFNDAAAWIAANSIAHYGTEALEEIENSRGTTPVYRQNQAPAFVLSDTQRQNVGVRVYLTERLAQLAEDVSADWHSRYLPAPEL